jgi:uncharacterized delta-60 repeat protein
VARSGFRWPFVPGGAAGSPLAEVGSVFRDGGLVTRRLGSGEDPFIGAIAVQPDGKIIVAGGSPPGDHGLLLARYLRDGSLDPSFGEGGYVETPFTYWAFTHAIALEPDGRIVVAGASYQGDDHVLSEFTLARYNWDGSLDTGFGTDGITNTVIPEQQPPNARASGLGIHRELSVLPSGDIWPRDGRSGGQMHAIPPFTLRSLSPDTRPLGRSTRHSATPGSHRRLHTQQ